MALSWRELRAACARRRIGAWALEGEEKASGLPLSLYVAAQLESKNYLAALAFRRHRERSLGTVWRGGALRRALSPRADHMIAIFDAPGGEGRRRPPSFEVPCWIYGELVLDQAMAWMRESRNVGRDLERVRRGRFTCEWTRSPSALAEFYRSMYLPYASRRYGEGSVLLAWPTFREAMSRSELLLVKREGEAVAAGVLVQEGSEIISWVLGVKDGDPALVKAGALSALYCFKIPGLKARGHQRVQIGSSRAFLSDGVLQFKRKWGARLAHASPEYLRVMVKRVTPGVGAFLRSNPFIYRRGGQLRGAVWASRVGTARDSEKLLGRYALPGLAGMDLYTLGTPSPLVTHTLGGTAVTLTRIDSV